MGLFDKIKSAIFGGASGEAKAAPGKASVPGPSVQTPSTRPTSVPSHQAERPAPAAPASPPQAPVDVEAILNGLARTRSGDSNWQTSIVDLLKLLDLDSSLDARKDLAAELGVNAGADGSAAQNLALHKAVMRKLSENGGKVPADLRD